jgi:hypothetical protein
LRRTTSPFRLDFHKGDLAVLGQHQVGKSVAHAPKILAHGTDHRSDTSGIVIRQEHAKRVNIDMIPSEDAVRAPPSRGNTPKDRTECIPRADGRKLRFDPHGKLTGETSVFQAMRNPVEATMQLVGFEQLIPEQEPEHAVP